MPGLPVHQIPRNGGERSTPGASGLTEIPMTPKDFPERGSWCRGLSRTRCCPQPRPQDTIIVSRFTVHFCVPLPGTPPRIISFPRIRRKAGIGSPCLPPGAWLVLQVAGTEKVFEHPTGTAGIFIADRLPPQWESDEILLSCATVRIGTPSLPCCTGNLCGHPALGPAGSTGR